MLRVKESLTRGRELLRGFQDDPETHIIYAIETTVSFLEVDHSLISTCQLAPFVCPFVCAPILCTRSAL